MKRLPRSPIDTPEVVLALREELDLAPSNGNLEGLAFLVHRLQSDGARPGEELEDILRRARSQDEPLERLAVVAEAVAELVASERRKHGRPRRAGDVSYGDIAVASLRSGVLPDSVFAIPRNFLPDWYWSWRMVEEEIDPLDDPVRTSRNR